ncbi:MAG: Fic family protein [Propionibacteriaceae bacterium]|nr:Fic family protein [Propionibacteriaceae bacterium]
MTVIDPYFDPAVNDLRNLLGARTSDELRLLEPQAVFANEIELADRSIRRTNNLRELCAIHAQLFRGVYDWAGHIRTVDIRKPDDDARFFLPVAYIDRAAGFVFGELLEAKSLKGLSVTDFIDRLAYFYDQLNYIHPFREGNGRAQRVFWQRVARDAGYFVDWAKVVGAENDAACRAAMTLGDHRPLGEMFLKIVDRTSPLTN